MKNKKGFTLVEILAVIAILGIIITIGITNYNNIKKKSLESNLKAKMDMASISANKYANDYKDDIWESKECRYITIGELINEGYLASDSKDSLLYQNPVDGSNLSNKVYKICYENELVTNFIENYPAFLKDLQVSPFVSNLTPSFNKNITEYDIIVPYNATSANINATLGANFMSYVDGYGPRIVTLNTGLASTTEVLIKVTSTSGIQTTYIVNIIKEALSDDNYLANIAITNGLLSPTFVKTTTTYNLKVDCNISSVTLTSTLNDPTASFESAYASPKAVSTFPSTIYFKVKNQLNEIRTYTVNVSKSSGTAKIPAQCTTYTASNNLLASKILNGRLICPDNIMSPNVCYTNGVQYNLVSNVSNGQGVYKNVKNASGIPSDVRNDGLVKFFRGNITNNYVKFGNILWRILWIGSDNSVRLITQSNYGSIKYQTVADRSTDAKLLGYTYNRSAINGSVGTPNNLKNNIDSWYNNNIKSYESKIKTDYYCSDTKASGYDASRRLQTWRAGGYSYNPHPTFKCPNSNVTYGGLYSLKAATITADEATFAGATSSGDPNINTAFFLYNGNSRGIWTMTPTNVWIDMRYIDIFSLGSSGNLHDVTSFTLLSYRPVITLKGTVEYNTGTGTSTDPYTIK